MTKTLLAAECQPEFIQKKEGFWKDEYEDPSDLYYYMAREEDRRHTRARYTSVAFAEDIEDTRRDLRNPNLSIWEKIYLNSYLQSQVVTRNSIATAEVLCTDIEFSKQMKIGIEQWFSKGLIYSVNNANDPNVSAWRQAYSTVNALTYNNLNLLTSLIPVTYLETGLTFAPVTRTAPVVKTLHAFNPANIYRWAARTKSFYALPVQEVRLLPASSYAPYNYFNKAQSLQDFSQVPYRGGDLYPTDKLQNLVKYLERRNVSVFGTDKSPCFIARADGSGQMLLPAHPTALQVKHELSHYLDFKKFGFENYFKMSRLDRERLVLERLQNNRVWNNLNEAERQFSIEYVNDLVIAKSSQ